MNKKYTIQVLRRLIITGLAFCMAFPANASIRDSIQEKIDKVAMRRVGHEFLQCLGDFNSRVLPVEKLGEQYKISFEKEFAFDPDDLISSLDTTLIKDALPTQNYLVEIEQCNTKEIVHSFVIGKFNRSNLIPCGGRVLPADCYNFLITIFDIQHLQRVPAPPSKFSNYFIWVGLLVLMLLSLLFFLKFRKTKKQQVDFLSLGSFQFDKKEQVLLHKEEKIELSNKEAALLLLLFAHANEAVEREKLLQEVWGDEGDYIGRTLDVFISKLRKKLAVDSSMKIVNIRGVGYKLVVS